MNNPATASDGQKEACKTYIEQTKLLVTLASAFLFAPVGLIAILKEKTIVGLDQCSLKLFIIVEVLFVCSVLSGYIVLGSLAGSQHEGKFNVYRSATRWLSLFQFGLYIIGLILFVKLSLNLFGL